MKGEWVLHGVVSSYQAELNFKSLDFSNGRTITPTELFNSIQISAQRKH